MSVGHRAFEGRLLDLKTQKTGIENIGECSVVIIAGPDRRVSVSALSDSHSCVCCPMRIT